MAEGGAVYFLDTSALVKLYHQEQGTEVVEEWAADRTAGIWLSDISRAELHSAFVRKVREGELTEAGLQLALECFREDLCNRLRTLDALQIASAQAVESNKLTFVTADSKLFVVASELFPRVMNPEANV